jgi:hypothetical protein
MAINSAPPTKKDKSWNFLATLFFILCLIALGYFMRRQGIALQDISLLELFIMSLAAYRLTRILVFDKIFKLFRDFIRSRSGWKVFYVIREIITCPWCAGVWVALAILVLYYFVPFGKLFIYILAISGIASFFVIVVNNIGLSTEERQHRVKQVKAESDYTKVDE